MLWDKAQSKSLLLWEVSPNHLHGIYLNSCSQGFACIKCGHLGAFFLCENRLFLRKFTCRVSSFPQVESKIAWDLFIHLEIHLQVPARRTGPGT